MFFKFKLLNCEVHTLLFDYFVTLTWIVWQLHYVKLWSPHIAIWLFCHVDLDCLPTPLCQIEKSTMPNCDVHIPKSSTPHCYLAIAFREVIAPWVIIFYPSSPCDPTMFHIWFPLKCVHYLEMYNMHMIGLPFQSHPNKKFFRYLACKDRYKCLNYKVKDYEIKNRQWLNTWVIMSRGFILRVLNYQMIVGCHLMMCQLPICL